MLLKTNGSVMKSERKLKKNSSRYKTMKTQPYKVYEMKQSSPKRKFHSNS